MNIVFAGTPAFAVPSLQALMDSGHRVTAVYTQPDRPAGRGRRVQASPVKQLALDQGLAPHQPAQLKQETEVLKQLQPDLMVVVAYGQLLPPVILGIPHLGCINVHASLLPRWRGAAPIARAIEAGDSVTGITLMQMDADMDTGDILDAAEIPISADDTAASLHDKLAPLGAQLLIRTLEKIERHEAAARRQDPTGACLAPKLRKQDAWLDWTQPAIELQRKIRAYNSWPVACTHWQHHTLRLWQADAVEEGSNAEPGSVIRADRGGIVVATGKNRLHIRRLQLAGAKSLSAAEFLNGNPMAAGETLY